MNPETQDALQILREVTPDSSDVSTAEFRARREAARRSGQHFENNSALRNYVRQLGQQLLEKADAVKVLPNDPKFSEKFGIQLGLIQAGNFLREEAADLEVMSSEEYSS